MKLVWSPETASKAYIETVKSCDLFQKSGEAELVSAMAAGWNAKFIVETWSHGGEISTSVGLAIARRHSGGRHVCIVPDEESRIGYVEAMGEVGKATEIVVGKAKDVGDELVGVDFMVVDCKFAGFVRVARFGGRGAVVVCRNGWGSFRWRNVFDEGESGRRIVRSVYLPVGKGLDIAHVGAIGGKVRSGKGRWFKHVDRQSGEEHVIRKYQ